MASADQDSGYHLMFGPWSDAGESAPAPDLPLLDLNSTDPLPLDLDRLESNRAAPAPSPVDAPSSLPGLAALPASATAAESPEEGATIWLDGDVLTCACPDCGAPMGIRLWLMLADCWQCAMSIELTEEQEREAMRLLERREQTRKQAAGRLQPVQKTFPTEAPRPTPPRRKETPRPSTPPRRRSAPQRRKRVVASGGAIGVRGKIHKLAMQGTGRVWLHETFKNTPAWLVSLVFHLVLLTLLGLILIENEKEEPFITLSMEVSSLVRTGGDPTALQTDKIHFDLPVPDKFNPKDDKERRAMQLADQEARQLRLSADALVPALPDVAQVKQLLRTASTQRRMLLARDPRLRVDMVKREGGTTLSEAAVSRALWFLSRQQNDDGGWGLGGKGRSDAAGTSLALLPYLGAGQTHLVGLHKDRVAGGLRWLLENQKPDGDLRIGLSGNHGMYVQGQAAIVLSEAYAMTGDEAIRQAAQKAVDFIVGAQCLDGGWRYAPRDRTGGDTSVVGWQLMALQSARSAGLDVPEATLEQADHFLDSVQHEYGSQYSYRPEKGPTEAMTAEGLLCRMYLGWNLRSNPGLQRGVDFLTENHLPDNNRPNMYYWYYATQVMHHMGGESWDRWNRKMRDILVGSQEKSGPNAGSWAPRDRYDSTGGRIYTTSLGACSLEVYYRHAPIFRQIALD